MAEPEVDPAGGASAPSPAWPPGRSPDVASWSPPAVRARRIDAVRYIGNRSSGKMGRAVADEAYLRGADVVLVSTQDARRRRRTTVVVVESADEMAAAVTSASARRRRARHGRGRRRLQAARRRGRQDRARRARDADRRARSHGRHPRLRRRVRACSASASPPRPGPRIDRARAKKAAKGVDLLVFNDILAAGVGIGSDENEITIIGADGEIHVPRTSKRRAPGRSSTRSSDALEGADERRPRATSSPWSTPASPTSTCAATCWPARRSCARWPRDSARTPTSGVSRAWPTTSTARRRRATSRVTAPRRRRRSSAGRAGRGRARRRGAQPGHRRRGGDPPRRRPDRRRPAQRPDHRRDARAARQGARRRAAQVAAQALPRGRLRARRRPRRRSRAARSSDSRSTSSSRSVSRRCRGSPPTSGSDGATQAADRRCRRAPGFDDQSEAYELFRRGRRFLDARPPRPGRAPARARARAGARTQLDPRGAGPRLLRHGPVRRARPTQFAAIVAERPDNDYAHFALGRCLLRLGRAAEALGTPAAGRGDAARHERPRTARRSTAARAGRPRRRLATGAGAQRTQSAGRAPVRCGGRAAPPVRHRQQQVDALLDRRVGVEEPGRPP